MNRIHYEYCASIPHFCTYPNGGSTCAAQTQRRLGNTNRRISMSTEQNKAIVRRAFEELSDKQNVEVMDELWAKEFIHHWSGQEEGRATWRESIRRSFSHQRPARLAPRHRGHDRRRGQGRVAVHLELHAHRAVLRHRADRQVYLMDWYQHQPCSDGKIAEEWANFDESQPAPAARQDRVSGGKHVNRRKQSCGSSLHRHVLPAGCRRIQGGHGA